MIVERTFQGAWRFSATVAGRSISRQYLGFSKREAMRRFRAECREIAATE